MRNKKFNTNKNGGSDEPQNNNTANYVGMFIIVFGLALLMKKNSFGLIPDWLFGWEMILLVIGLVIGVNSRFEKKSSIVLIAIGGFFLLKDLFGSSFGSVVFPIAVVALGVYLLKRNRSIPPIPPHGNDDSDIYDWDKRVKSENKEDYAFGNPATDESERRSEQSSRRYSKYTTEYDNYLKADSFFSDTKKVILTDNFLGATITSVFGSTSINFLQADIQKPVVIDTFQLFGSTKIIIPTNWKVSSNVASVFGELDDRRPIMEITTDNNKKLYLTGTTIFGGLTIKNS